ncbi:MAG: 4-hydroxy-tetrahydrodipicolinate synthase [Candidatus Levyibacteriota bacterium]|nr:MAG: 4-hydroxy-tetrahydrodipicolinate synthase [Candidatus Levybacteria bacterium]
MKKLIGAITALVTPFTENGKVDIAALRKLVRFQIESGISGLVPCGSTGEAATLSEEEYQLVISTVVKEVKGKVPVVAGAGSNDTVKAIKNSKIAKKAGADMLLHVTPYYNKPTPAGLLAHFKTIANAVDMPIILYNVPGRTGSNITAATTLDIAKKVDHVIGVKEASGNINQMMEIVKGAPSHFSILSGDDALTLPLIAVGGQGIISVVANETPKEFSDMVNFALNGNFEKAKNLHYKLLDLMNVNFIESNPIPVKTALALMGKIKEVYRLPLTKISDKNKEVVANVLKEGGWL